MINIFFFEYVVYKMKNFKRIFGVNYFKIFMKIDFGVKFDE